MKLKEYNIMLDLKKTERNQYIEVVQGDYDTNILNINLVEDNDPVDLTGTEIEIAFDKPDRTTVLQEADEYLSIEGAEEGIIKCMLKTNTIAAAGRVGAEVRILQGDKLLTTAQFEFYVRKAIVNEQTLISTNEFPMLERMVDQLTGMIQDFPKIKVLGTFYTLEELETVYPDGSHLEGGFFVGGEFFTWGTLDGKWGNLGTFKGPEGPQGEKGDPGTSLKILGSFNSVQEIELEFPEGSELDGGFLIGEEYYYWNILTETWENAGPLQGAKGDKGDTGPQGPAGPQGPQGIKGDSGNDAEVTESNIIATLGYIPADANALTNHISNSLNPHSVTKNQIQLGNVDNIKQMPIAGGTFTGVAIAQDNTAYSSAQIRNVRIFAEGETVPVLANGVIALIYES